MEIITKVVAPKQVLPGAVFIVGCFLSFFKRDSALFFLLRETCCASAAQAALDLLRGRALSLSSRPLRMSSVNNSSEELFKRPGEGVRTREALESCFWPRFKSLPRWGTVGARPRSPAVAGRSGL